MARTRCRARPIPPASAPPALPATRPERHHVTETGVHAHHHPAAPRTRSRRLLHWITWLAIIAPAPYAVSRLLWAAGIPLGIDEQLLHDDFQAPGWGSLQILMLAALCEATGLYAAVFIRDRRREVPDRVPLIGGRRAIPGLVVAPLLAPILILAAFNAWGVRLMLDGFTMPPENHG